MLRVRSLKVSPSADTLTELAVDVSSSKSRETLVSVETNFNAVLLTPLFISTFSLGVVVPMPSSPVDKMVIL